MDHRKFFWLLLLLLLIFCACACVFQLVTFLFTLRYALESNGYWILYFVSSHI